MPSISDLTGPLREHAGGNSIWHRDGTIDLLLTDNDRETLTVRVGAQWSPGQPTKYLDDLVACADPGCDLCAVEVPDGLD